MMRWWHWLCGKKRDERPELSAETWRDLVCSIPILQGLTEAEQQQLIRLAGSFLQQKSITCLGVRPTPRQLGWMALQACLPILYLGLDWYRNFYEVILLPDPIERMDPVWLDDQVMGAELGSHLGEAWEQGPVVLVWPEVLHDGQWDGYHLVVHELVHKLDMLAGGVANGMPPERPGVPIAEWQSVVERAYQRLCERAAEGESLWLDEQACEGTDEYLAIACEAFFTQPQQLYQQEAELYRLLSRWFAQDPKARQPAAAFCSFSLGR